MSQPPQAQDGYPGNVIGARERECGSKHRYSSDSAALAQAQWLMRYTTKKMLHTYHCIWCHGYHLSSSQR